MLWGGVGVVEAGLFRVPGVAGEKEIAQGTGVSPRYAEIVEEVA